MHAFGVVADGGDRMADRDEIRHALSILLDPEYPHELRALPSQRWDNVTLARLDKAADVACDMAIGHVYYSLNPIAKAGTTASKKTVRHRRWLLIDCDPVRAVELSSTDAEKLASLALACDVIDMMTTFGWPSPLVVDSGNGYHVLYRIDLPNDDLAHQWVKAVLVRLAGEFDDDGAKVDTKVADPPRIAKLPGTWARKGPDTPERPHRPCKIYYEPESLEVVPVELIRDFANPPKLKKGEKKSSFKATATEAGKDAYVARAVECECLRVSLAPVGERNNILNDSAFRLGTLAHYPEASGLDIPAKLLHAARRAGLPEAESLITIRSGWEAGKLKPRERPADQATTGKTGLKPGTPLITWADKITPRKVEFLWPGRIPLGKLTTFAGQGGLGKTFVLCDIAARVSRGLEWPFGGGECAKEGKVLFISGEDDEDDTLVPRLIECGADLTKIAFLSPEAQDDFTLAALDLLNKVLDEMDGVTFVAVDPPTSYLGDVDDHRNAELRSLLTPLKRWAAKRKAAVIFNTHVTKATGKDVEAATRVMGSVAWVNAVRAAHLFLKDEQEPDKVYFAPIKCNVARMPQSLTYSIVPTGDGWAKVEWLAEHDQSADQVIKSAKKSAGVCAVEWLEQRFREHRVWESEELKREALSCGLTFNQVFKSAEVNALPIQKRPEPDMNGVRRWYWHALPGWPQERPSESSESPKVGT